MEEQRHSGWQIADIVVIGSGLLTSALALLVVYWIGRSSNEDFQIMGWYAAFIFPVGAMLVGLVAGSGYGLMSWITGRKITGTLLIVIVLLLALSFAAAQWIEFRSLRLEDFTGKAVDFFRYYDVTTRSMTFKASHAKTPSGSLGLFGYLFRLLELAGFTLGGLIIPLAFKAKPYCEPCLTYMRKAGDWWLPAAVPARKIAKKDKEALQVYEQEMKEAYEKSLAQLNSLNTALSERNTSQFQSILGQYGLEAKAVRKLQRRIRLTLSTCPKCRAGVLDIQIIDGQGDKTKITKLGKELVDAGFTTALGNLQPRPNMKIG